MRAILLLENGILIADAWDVQWSENNYCDTDWTNFNSINKGIFGQNKRKIETEFGFKCDHHFIKSFFEEGHFRTPKRIPKCLVIFEDLSYKYFYGLQPRTIEYGDFYSKIDFSVDYFEDNISKNHNIENLWLRHNRNKRIDEILG